MAQCLKFIVSGEKVDGKAVDFLKKAANEAADAEIDVDWFTIEDLNKDPSKYGDGAVVVCESFEGKVFDLLQSLGSRIVGPACVLSCLRTVQPLPSMAEPCLSVAMLNVVACCTNITSEHRSKLKNLIVSMGGIMIGDFTQSVTHLIAGEVGSTKYQVACDIHKPIVQPSWVYDCWDQSKYKVVNMTSDSMVRKHACLCFKGLTVCVTGLSAEVRSEVKKLTEENGGKYSGELKMRTCTHLIVKMAKGEKYNYARQWKIHCISPQWFYECIQSGHWVDEGPFEVMPGEESLMDESKILDIAKTRVNMTLQSDIEYSMVSSKAAKVAEKSIRNRENVKSTEDKTEPDSKTISMKNNATSIKLKPYNIEEFDLKGMQMKSSMLLDGCKIYLCEMPSVITDQLRKLVNSAGAMRFNQLNSNITHIIMGAIISKEVKEYIEKTVHRPFVVTPDWLVESCQAGKMLSEKAYSVIEEDELELVMAKPSIIPEAKRQEESKKKDKNTVPAFQLDNDLEDDDVFLGYLPQAESSRISFTIESKPSLPEIRTEKQRMSDELQKSDSAEAIAGSKEEMGDSVGNGDTISKVISKCKFVIKFFEEETAGQLKSLIAEFDGKVINQEARCDYVIVPLTFEKKRRIGKKEVTICWLEQSLEKGELLDNSSSFLFKPFQLPNDCLPLKDCVISVSQFSGIEREHLIQVADLLGAVMQENFVRKAGNGLLANTHLLLAEASGAKFEAACKWGVFCVSKQWLFACAESKKLVPVEDHPLKESDEESCVEQIEERGMDEEGNANEVAAEAEDNYRQGKIDKGLALTKDETTMKEVVDVPEEKSVMSKGFATPKVKPLLQIGKPFKPSFDLDDMKEYLKSPASCFTPRSKSRVNSESFAWDEYVGDQLRKALEITGGVNSKASGTAVSTEKRANASKFVTTGQVNDQIEAVGEKPEARTVKNENGILNGVVLAVSKKVIHRQTDIHNLASLLGAECQFGFDDHCTHLIHKGKLTDALTEVKQARSLKKQIVSEHWLEACLESNTRVQENLYPCTYNPKMSLAVVTTGKRSTRASKSSSTDSKRISTNKGKRESNSKNDESQILNNQPEIATEEDPRDSPEKSTRTTEDLEDLGDISSDQLAAMKKMVSPPSVEKASSLDARLEFKRQMEELMEATKGSKGGLRRNRRQQLSSSSPADDLSLKRSSVAKRLRSRQSSQKSNSESSKSSGDKKQGSKETGFQTIEPSQGDVITYDDPAGRLERERILAQLKAASPSQDGVSEFRPIEVSDFPLDDVKEPIENDATDAVSNSSLSREVSSPEKQKVDKQHFQTDFDHLTTPPKCPVNMHISKPVQPPQPISLLEDDDTQEYKQAPKMTYKFLLSAMTPQEKIHYSAMIEELGGIICDAQYFTLECTHVIVGTPNRNEKFLASVAAGKWVLHKSFLEASREAGSFVNEAEHEWGTEVEPSKLTVAAQRWRQKLEKERQTTQTAGAFKGWHVLLCVGSSVRQHGFKRMLEAGSGSVASIHPPFNSLDGVTHAFIDPSKVKPGVIDYKTLHDAGIWVLRPDYIADYLTQDPPPPTLKYVVQEVQKLMEVEANVTSFNESKKRKYADEKSSQKTKRTRK